MRGQIIKGQTTEQKLRSAEAAVKRLRRKSYNARVSSYITPFPVSSFIKEVPEDGVVLRYMFPGNGTITNACVYVKGDTKHGIEISAQVKNESGMGSGVSATFRKNFNKLFLDLYVMAGDMLQIVLPADKPITNIWVAFLWAPEIGETEVKSFLLRELEKLEESQDA